MVSCDDKVWLFVIEIVNLIVDILAYYLLLEPHPLLNVRSTNKQPAAGKKGGGKRLSK